jgi:hypothetical protein
MSLADELNWRPATELARLIRSKAVGPAELLQAHLATIERLNPKINAICTLAAESAMAAAQRAERAVVAGAATPPFSVPRHYVPAVPLCTEPLCAAILNRFCPALALTFLRRPTVGSGACTAHQHCSFTVAQAVSFEERLDGLLVIDDGVCACPVGAPQAAIKTPSIEHAGERIPDVRERIWLPG